MRTVLMLAAAGALVFLIAPEPADAQLVRVTETIYGMDCAPCAYGVERRLTRMDGVTDVTLSLNEGFADVVFADRNSITLNDIRTAIRRSGFSGEGGRVSVRARIERSETRTWR
jgi:copper chaperone CopZ